MTIPSIALLDFEKTIQHGRTIILFWAQWCGLCPFVIEHLTNLYGEYSDCIEIGLADFDEYISAVHDYSVYGTPTVTAFYEGALIGVWAGLREEADYRQIIEEFMERHP
ncbi:MAG: thioredoxin family protein [Clostridium sp.]|jgi:thioredoxin-like negative regulator of GroEL|nr:thioredoxin family protein [Clostridium sp.]